MKSKQEHIYIPISHKQEELDEKLKRLNEFLYLLLAFLIVISIINLIILFMIN